MINRISNKYNQQAFGTLKVMDEYISETEKVAVIEPLSRFSESHFGKFNEIHVDLSKSAIQNGIAPRGKVYHHSYDITLFPFGTGKNKPKNCFTVVAHDFISFKKNLETVLEGQLEFLFKCFEGVSIKQKFYKPHLNLTNEKIMQLAIKELKLNSNKTKLFV